MSVTYKAGFTIIETMLFLAITGVLIVGILAGTGTSINIQRYHDSVTTLSSVLQQQYSEVSSVTDEVPTTPISCDSTATVNTSGTTLARGQSDCVVLGRFTTIDGQNMTTSTVVGHAKSSGPYANDIAELQDYNLSVLATSVQSSVLDWGAQIAWPVSGSGSHSPTTPRSISLLILRSPTSGLMYTFSSNATSTSPTELHNMIIAGISGPLITGNYGGQMERRICVDANNSGLGFGGGMAVLVGAYASNASSIQIRSNDMGDPSRC